MADLPIEVWHSIFERLEDLTDLFSCALISKAFYFAVKEYRIREIAFTGRVHRWFHYTTPITNHKHRIDFTKASILSESSSFNFDYLKRLKIGRTSGICLNVINQFVHLEELDIDLKNYENKKSTTLSLANLKVLYVFVPDFISFVELNTPALAEVYTFSLKRLEFIYPESVRCIHTFCHAGKLSTFPNVEYLFFTDHYNALDYLHSYNSQSFEEFSLATLKKLKEIDFYYFYFRYENWNMSVFKRIASNLLALRRPDLKVFWMNVRVTHISMLTEYQSRMEKGRVDFQFRNYEKLKDQVEYFWWYDFNGSMSKLRKAGFSPRSEEFRSKFFAKFSFRRIKVNGFVKERELLMELIARSSNELCLEFSGNDLDQEFFDQMAETVRMNCIPLRWLRLENFSNGVLNFEFVTKLLDLEAFKTDQQLPNELVSKLLGLPMLAIMKFKKNSSGEIFKENRATVHEKIPSE